MTSSTCILSGTDEQISDRRPFQFLGSVRSAALDRAIDQLAPAIQFSEPILLLGERGTGKGIFARSIHNSSRPSEQYRYCNCANLPPTLLESELFGHTKGSFTNATCDFAGAMQDVGNGTLFLDEVGELHPEVQAKILHVVEDREFRRLGDNRNRIFAGRIIAATNQPLSLFVREGRFRADLLDRLSVFRVKIPALREQPEIVDFAFRQFVAAICAERNTKNIPIESGVEEILRSHTWPGNFRELKTVAIRAVADALYRSVPISADFLRSQVDFESGEDVPIRSVYRLSRNELRSVLASYPSQMGAARQLGIPVSSLRDICNRYNLTLPRDPRGRKARVRGD